MTTKELLREKREEILTIVARHGGRDVRVFGPAARDKLGEKGEIDLLIRLEKSRRFMEYATLCLDLKELLGREVNIVIEGSVYCLFRRRTLKEAKPL